MKNSLFALFLAMTLTSSAFAGLKIECKDRRGTRLTFSNTGYSGKAYLYFADPYREFDIDDNTIEFSRAIHSGGGMIVKGLFTGGQISFHIPKITSLIGQIDLGNFTTVITIDKHLEGAETSKSFNMKCTSECVFY